MKDKPMHCREERISQTLNPICEKRVRRADEVLSNVCRNCGRPFEVLMLGGEDPQ